MLLTTLAAIGLFILTLLLSFFKVPLLVLLIAMILTLIIASHLLGDATEELANYYSPALGGLLNATLGNLAELIIAFFALKQGLLEVVKASITGSILGNILFVFGLAVIVGGIKKKELPLKKQEAEVSSTMLLITVLLLLFPSLLFVFHEESRASEISLIIAGCLFVLYFLSLFFSFYTHKEWFISVSHEKPKLKKSHAFLLMFLSIVILIITSEGFAKQLETIAHGFGFSELFVGAILVGIAGNAAEHLGALHFAAKEKMSLVLNVTIGSSLQVAMFVVPLLVFGSFFFGNMMTLSFLPLEIVSILAAVLLLNEISKDNAVTWLEGVQMVVLYGVIAVLFFFHP